jgi:hypothetical protein
LIIGGDEPVTSRCDVELDAEIGSSLGEAVNRIHYATKGAARVQVPSGPGLASKPRFGLGPPFVELGSGGGRE